ncbi:MAG: EF-hand domain-containing protein [Zetaproteobacteria bacterium]|nr:MAG: EF-hand domain-containing protein [Zetaproteobacteria bacterium]
MRMRWLMAAMALVMGLGAAQAQESGLDRVVERFMALDEDASGTVSWDEYWAMVQERAKARFDEMDADGDGEVSEDEFRRFWRQRKAFWYRPGH